MILIIEGKQYFTRKVPRTRTLIVKVSNKEKVELVFIRTGGGWTIDVSTLKESFPSDDIWDIIDRLDEIYLLKDREN